MNVLTFITIIFLVFIINLIVAGYYYFAKVRKHKNPRFSPSNQLEDINDYLLHNKVSAVELYFLKYSFLVNVLLVILWFYLGLTSRG